MLSVKGHFIDGVARPACEDGKTEHEPVLVE